MRIESVSCLFFTLACGNCIAFTP